MMFPREMTMVINWLKNTHVTGIEGSYCDQHLDHNNIKTLVEYWKENQ